MKKNLDKITYFLLFLDWLAGGEALEVQNLVFNNGTQVPTEAGIVLLAKAGVKMQDMLLFGSPKNGAKRMRSPTVESRIQSTLALLKVAAVIAKERFEKQSKIERVRNATNRKKSIVNITNAKFGADSSNSNISGSVVMKSSPFQSPVISRQGSKQGSRFIRRKRDTLSMQASDGYQT